MFRLRTALPRGGDARGNLLLAPPSHGRPRAAAGADSRGPFSGGVGARRRLWAAARVVGSGLIPRLLPDLGSFLQKGDVKGTYFPGPRCL